MNQKFFWPLLIIIVMAAAIALTGKASAAYSSFFDAFESMLRPNVPAKPVFDKQIKEISPNDRRLELSLAYNNSTLRFTGARVTNGRAPLSDVVRGKYMLKVLDGQDRVINHHPFDIRNIFNDLPPQKGDNQPVAQLILPQLSFALTVNWDSSAAKAQIVSADGTILSSINLVNIPVIDNKPRYRTIRGDSFVRNKNLITYFFHSPVTLADQNTLDIVFIGNNYLTASDLNLFHQDVNFFIATLLSFEPFKSRASQIVFHYIDNTADLDCNNYGRIVICNDDTVVRLVNNSGVPYDKIMVIDNVNTYGGSGGRIAVATNGPGGSLVFVHEFGGHSFAELLDEYTYGTRGGHDNLVHKNCYGGNPPAAEWSNIVPLDGYHLGCTNVDWYRSSETSIMMELDPTLRFNAVSQRLINKKLDFFAGPITNPPTDIILPVSMILSPISGAIVSKNVVQVLASVSDNNGVARAELWVDDTLHSTVYNSPFNFTWITKRVASGRHVLMVKAYDVAGNVGASPVVEVQIAPSADRTRPSVAISSPLNNETVAGIATVDITASDDSGTVDKVELYRDNVLLDTDVAQPFSFLWDTNMERDGAHSLKAKAHDRSGNISWSAVIRVSAANVSDISPPTVNIIKPPDGAVLPRKKTKIIAKATDNNKVAKLEISLNGSIVKTCLSAGVCSRNVKTSTLPPGSHIIGAKAYDIAGNMGEASVTVNK